LDTIGATLYQVSTLLMFVGFPYRALLGRERRADRGRPDWLSRDAISAVSSPQTKAPAPSTVSISKRNPRPSTLSPRTP